MYNGFKEWIKTGKFDLNDIAERIDTAFAMGKITKEEYKELIEKSRESAHAENSYAPIQEQVNKAFEMIARLQEKINAIKGSTSSDVEKTTDEWSAWTQPTGAHDAYYAGMQMTYTDGKRYTCIAPEGVACVWGPDVMPGYWKEEA